MRWNARAYASWATAFSRGDFEAALSHAAAGLSLYEADRDAVLAGTYGSHDAGACGRYFSARALALIGRTDEAVRTSDEAIAHARNLGHPFSLALAYVFAATVAQARRDPASTRAHATAAARIAREQDFRLILAWASVFDGWAAVEDGRHEEGLDQIRGGVAETLATGSQQFVTHFLGLLAAAHLLGGEHEAGLKAVDEGLAIVRRTGERFYEAELHRVRGELPLVADGEETPSLADEAFAQALDVARGQGAKLLVVRAAISRSRLWGQLGRDDEARQLVRSACDDLTEPLPDPDSIEVNALLDE